MNRDRFKHLQQMIGYDNEALAKMLKVEVTMVAAFSSGEASIPDNLAQEFELFVDWASEVGDTTVKRDLAKKHLGKAE